MSPNPNKLATEWPWAGDPMRLREDFARDGFVHIPSLFSYDEMCRMRVELDRYVREVLPALPSDAATYAGPECSDRLVRFAQMYECDEWFMRLFRGSRLEDVAILLLDSPVVGHNMQYFNKPAGHGGVTPPHQDGAYLMIEPCEAVNIWLALEDVDETTGCLRYVRGSRWRGLRPHAAGDVTTGFSREITDYGRPEDLDNEVACPARLGDVLVHHAVTIHRADANRSALRSRQAIGLVYIAESVKHDAERFKTYQAQLRAARSSTSP